MMREDEPSDIAPALPQEPPPSAQERSEALRTSRRSRTQVAAFVLAVCVLAAAVVAAAQLVFGESSTGPSDPIDLPQTNQSMDPTGGPDAGQTDLACRTDTFLALQPGGDGLLPEGATKALLCTRDRRRGDSIGPMVSTGVHRIIEMINSAPHDEHDTLSTDGTDADSQNCVATLQVEHVLILEYPQGFQRALLREGTGECDRMVVERTPMLGAAGVLALVEELAR